MPVEAVMRPGGPGAANVFRQIQPTGGSRFKGKVWIRREQPVGIGRGARVAPRRRRAACFHETVQEDLFEQQPQVTTGVGLRGAGRVFPQWGVHDGG